MLGGNGYQDQGCESVDYEEGVEEGVEGIEGERVIYWEGGGGGLSGR